jgi:hypothetical protein
LPLRSKPGLQANWQEPPLQLATPFAGVGQRVQEVPQESTLFSRH